MVRFDFVTLFPSLILDVFNYSIPKRAKDSGLADYFATDPREFTTDKHRTVDDNPYGGGPGMLMKPGPVCDALDSLPQLPTRAVVFTEPTGEPFTQASVAELANFDQIVFVCGHYEGIDQRAQDLYATHVYSLGDFVLSGGEYAAIAMADAVIRTLPGALGAAESLQIDSHSDGLLSAPQYTRPEEFRGLKVPEVLTSGNHAEIRKWKRKQSLLLTKQKRPDLLSKVQLDKADTDMLI